MPKLRPHHLPWRRVVVSGPSMVPALRSGDVLVVRWSPGKVRFSVGSVVVVAMPDRPLAVKRVVAIGNGGVEVEGDNALASADSRTFGPVPRGAIKGRVLLRLWPRPGFVDARVDLGPGTE